MSNRPQSFQGVFNRHNLLCHIVLETYHCGIRELCDIYHANVQLIKVKDRTSQTGGFVRLDNKCYDPGKTQDCQLLVRHTWKYPALPVLHYTLGRSVGRSVGRLALCSFCDKLGRMQPSSLDISLTSTILCIRDILPPRPPIQETKRRVQTKYVQHIHPQCIIQG